MQSPELFAALTNRSILDQRFATSLNDETLTILNDLAKYLRTRINSEGTRISTQKRLEMLLSEVEKRTEQVYSDIQELYFEQFRELSIDEADFVAASMQSVVVGDVVVESVSNQRLWNAITKNPLNLGNDNGYVNFKKMIKDLGDNAAKVASMISGGYAEGLTNQEIVQGLIGTRANGYSDGIIDKSRRDANAIVRTALNHVTTEARNEVYRQNSDIVYGYRIVATIDTRTSATCRGYDQKVVRNSDKFKPLPPFHYNCLLPDTNVITCDGVSSVFKRAYKGIAVDILTKSGFSLSVTPNHPILTSRGWVAAEDINGSDKLATIADGHVVVDNQKDSAVASISDIFSALEVSCDSSSITNRPTTTEDFHGDFSNADVSVIKVNSLIWGAAKSILDKKVNDKPLFIRSNSTFDSFSSFDSLFSASFSAFSGSVSFPSEHRFGFCGSCIHPSLLLFRSISDAAKLTLYKLFNWSATVINTDMTGYTTNADTSLVGFNNSLPFKFGECNDRPIRDDHPIAIENPLDWLVTNSEDLPDFLNSHHVDGVKFDDVVNVIRRKVDTHVYNLENKNNWYIANGIITHNCRTTTVPEMYDKYLKDTGATRAVNFKKQGDVKAGKVGQVSAQQQYYEILKRQPAAQQDLVLGKARGLIFRNSGLSADEFRKAMTDTMGNPLTLKDMARENKKILDYMQSNKFLDGYVG